MGRKKIPLAVREQIRAMWVSGAHTQAEIAQEVGVSPAFVSLTVKGVEVAFGPESNVFKHLSFDQAQRIREIYSRGTYTQTDLATLFQVTQSTISLVIRNKTHTAPPNRRLTPEQVQQIRLRATGYRSKKEPNQGALAEEFGVSQPTISAIVSGKLYSDVPMSDEELEHHRRVWEMYRDAQSKIGPPPTS